MVDHITVHSHIPILHGQVSSRKTPLDLDVDPILDLQRKVNKPIFKSLLSFAQYFVPSLTRAFDFSTSSLSSKVNNARSALCEVNPADVRWREGRPWVLADEVGFEEGSE